MPRFSSARGVYGLYELLCAAPITWDVLERACGSYERAYQLMGELVALDAAVQDQEGCWSARPWWELSAEARATIDPDPWARPGACGATTRLGTPCVNTVSPPGGRCHHHDDRPRCGARSSDGTSCRLPPEPDMPTCRVHGRVPEEIPRDLHVKVTSPPFAARYVSMCALCRDSIEQGYTIVRIAPPGEWVHAGCAYLRACEQPAVPDATDTTGTVARLETMRRLRALRQRTWHAGGTADDRRRGGHDD